MKNKKILITGPPGVGKTTLVKKVCELLTRHHKLRISGFYTQELREAGERKGFDVVTLDGKISNLALKSFVSAIIKQRSPSVGQYSVNISSFEKTALPTLQGKIGKMKLFSKPFVAQVRRLFDHHPLNILATIPIAPRAAGGGGGARGKSLQLVDEVRQRSDVTLIHVSRENRDELVSKVVSLLVE